jgi:hypothetical protein
MGRRTFMGVAFLLLFGGSLRADGVMVGAPAVVSGGNCIPFGCPIADAVTAYQQIYSSAAFSGAFNVARIDFFNTQDVSGGVPAGGTYTLDLSYTSRSVGALTGLTPADNITSGNQLFFGGTLPALVGGVMAFNGSPFAYDPTLGNLLLTIQCSGATDSSSILFLDQSQNESQTSKAIFASDFVGPHGGSGLVTEFDTAAVATPEPSSLLFLLIAGVLGLICITHRKSLV